MPTLNINGKAVTVDDSFLKLTPAQQDATVDEIAKSMPAEQSGIMDTVKDVGGAAAAGIARGAADLVGLPGTIGDAINNGLSYATGLPQLPQSPVSGGSLRQAESAVSGGASDYQGKSTPAKYAGTIGEFVPGALATGGGISGLTRFAALPGAASEAAGEATEGTKYEPYARAAAALAAPMAPAVMSRAVSPFGGAISAERQAAANLLQSEGVTPTAGQLTGSQGLRYAESELGGGRAAAAMDEQARAFTDAAMRRGGGQGLADPANMTAMRDRLSQGFNNISARTALTSDPQLGRGIGQTLREYDRVLPSAQREIVNNMADDIISVFAQNNGTMSGEIYQATRSRLGRMSKNASTTDPEFSQALRGLRDTLDDGMARSIPPQDAAEWARLRQQYGNMKVLEKAATGAGESAAMGTISPAKLRQAASAGRQGQYARAEGDLDALARAGQQLMTPLPNSGTAARLATRGLMSLPAGLGAVAGGASGDVLTGIAAALAGAAVPRTAGAALMSRPGQAFLSNQLMQPRRLADPRLAGVVEALMSQQGDRRNPASR